MSMCLTGSNGRQGFAVALTSAAILLLGLALSASPAAATDYYVDGSAPPGGDGSIGNPFQTIQQGLNAALSPGDNVIVRGGTYLISAELSFKASGTPSAWITLKAAEGETVNIVRNPSANVRLLVFTRNYIAAEGLNFDGNYGTANGLVRFYAGSHHHILRNCEVKRHANHMVRLDADDVLVEDCHIHHAITTAALFGADSDAHCTMSPRGFRHTFRRCDIHHASGDLWQGETDAPWGDIVFEDCDLHIEPAEPGDPDLQYPISAPINITENCLDTKDDGSGVFNHDVTVRNCLVRGSRASRVSTGGALNLKRRVTNFFIYNSLIYDNRVAFRLRAPSTNYLIYNNIIFDNDVCFRLEDGISGLDIFNNTLYDNSQAVRDDGGAPSNLTFKNNIFMLSFGQAYNNWWGTYSNNLFWQVTAGWSDPNAVVADPQFADVAGADFHLLELRHRCG